MVRRYDDLPCHCFDTSKFKGHHWATVAQVLEQHPHHTWGVTLDLANFYFHLGLSKKSQ